MTALDGYQLTDRFTKDDGTVFLTGIQALARLPLEQLRADRIAGLKTASFVSGYPGSPLGGYGEAVKRAARTAPDLPLVFRQGLNEEFAATSVMGSQLASARPDAKYDGVIGIWYGKAPGVDRAADALRHATFAGTSMHGGAVAIVGDDPNAKSSALPSSSAGLMSDMHMPVLYPGDPTEALILGRHAIALSRATGLWTALKIVADVADATANMELHPERFTPILPLVDGEPYQHHPNGNILTPFTLDYEREIIEVRYELARRYAADNRLNHVTVQSPDAWLGIMSSGITYREVREALHRLGLRSDEDIANAGIRLLKMGMPLPFNTHTVRSFAEGLDEFLVIEEKHGILESLVKDAIYSAPHRPKVVGKTDEQGQTLFPGWGALDADTILPLLRSRLEERVGSRLVPHEKKRERILIPLAVERQPFFCSGCPHNRSTEVPDGTAVGAGVGCHTMALFMDPDRVGDVIGLTAMGNEGMHWVGMAEFVDTEHLVQNLGDGTFFHSGQLAIQAAVAAGTNITFKLLFNGTVAMTGGQDPMGQISPTKLVPGLLAVGVKRVIVTADETARYRDVSLPSGVEVWERHRLLEAQETLAKVEGVTVLLHDQACAAEARRARKRGLIETPNQRVVINQRICEGCGDCGEVSNCLSVQPVETAFGRKTKIDQTTCNLDFSCLEGDCPSFVSIVPEPESGITGWLARRSTRKLLARSTAPAPSATSVASPPPVPAPKLVVPTDEFAMRITGIGGTGVVTVAQIIGTAAMLDGKEVRGLDQIGLSQKAGPVVSDIRISSDQASFTNRLGEQQADLLLAFDQLVAASPKGLLTCDPERTHVVGSNSQSPTGHMITHLDTELPPIDELKSRIGEHTRPGHHWVDAQTATTNIFGSSTTANIFVVGMAVQAGTLPITPATLERAIELNGVAVEQNVAAFRWGRAQVANPTSLPSPGPNNGEPTPPPTISAVLSRRIDHLDLDAERRSHHIMLASELVAWGDEQTAITWFDVLDEVHKREQAVRPGSGELLDVVAGNLFKLTAYKDEYEVARLMVDPEAMAEAANVAGAKGAISWKLHPPMLRALGYDKKVNIGVWAVPAIRQLAKRKHLRGTSKDPFGRAHVRKVERQLPGEYVTSVQRALEKLTTANFDDVVSLAALPDMVRGYEDIKLANVEKYRTALADAESRIG